MTYKENEFTRPSLECMHPEYWTTENAGATENEVIEMFAGMVRGIQPDYVIELGTYQGHMAEQIGWALDENGHGHLDTIESVPENVYEARKRCAALPVTIIQDDLKNFIPKNKIDMGWIDAGPEGVKDLERLWPYFQHGAILGVHDSRRDDILGPLLSLPKSCDFVALHLKTPRGLALIRVTQ